MLRSCPDIGMPTIDRPHASCRWRSAWCRVSCYNLKFWRWPTVKALEPRLAHDWTHLDASALARQLHRFPFHDRLRLCTRGEPLADPTDVDRLVDLARAVPSTLLWIPTRAWRAPWADQLTRLRQLPNVRCMASTDPTTTPDELRQLRAAAWSVMFTGDDDRPHGWPCPKTWHHAFGHCRYCRAGCFSTRRVEVHLRTHL